MSSLSQLKINTDIAKKVMEAHIESKGLNYTRRADSRIVVPFDGFTIVFTARDSQHSLVSLTSTLDSKVDGRSQLGVACKYAAKVNYSLNIGSVQIDVRDGEITFYHAVPLEGMSALDAGALLKSWFDIFCSAFAHYYPGLKVIASGGSIEQAERVVSNS